MMIFQSPIAAQYSLQPGFRQPTASVGPPAQGPHRLQEEWARAVSSQGPGDQEPLPGSLRDCWWRSRPHGGWVRPSCLAGYWLGLPSAPRP